MRISDSMVSTRWFRVASQSRGYSVGAQAAQKSPTFRAPSHGTLILGAMAKTLENRIIEGLHGILASTRPLGIMQGIVWPNVLECSLTPIPRTLVLT